MAFRGISVACRYLPLRTPAAFSCSGAHTEPEETIVRIPLTILSFATAVSTVQAPRPCGPRRRGRGARAGARRAHEHDAARALRGDGARVQRHPAGDRGSAAVAAVRLRLAPRGALLRPRSQLVASRSERLRGAE